MKQTTRSGPDDAARRRFAERYARELAPWVGAEVDALVEGLLLEFPLDQGPVHGAAHVYEVLKVGLELAERSGARKDVVVWFAFLHDRMRRSDWGDGEHGKRAAAMIRDLCEHGRLPLDEDGMRQLVLACRDHAEGTISDDPTLGPVPVYGSGA